MRVLIVEDEELLRDAYAIVLSQKGYDVETAANGQIAIDKLEKYKPHLIILDMLMPIMGGKEFLKAINKPKNYPKINVIVMTNLSTTASKTELQKLGANELVLKSDIAPNHLVKLVKRFEKK